MFRNHGSGGEWPQPSALALPNPTRGPPFPAPEPLALARSRTALGRKHTAAPAEPSFSLGRVNGCPLGHGRGKSCFLLTAKGTVLAVPGAAVTSPEQLCAVGEGAWGWELYADRGGRHRASGQARLQGGWGLADAACSLQPGLVLLRPHAQEPESSKPLRDGGAGSSPHSVDHAHA